MVCTVITIGSDLKHVTLLASLVRGHDYMFPIPRSRTVRSKPLGHSVCGYSPEYIFSKSEPSPDSQLLHRSRQKIRMTKFSQLLSYFRVAQEASVLQCQRCATVKLKRKGFWCTQFPKSTFF